MVFNGGVYYDVQKCGGCSQYGHTVVLKGKKQPTFYQWTRL